MALTSDLDINVSKLRPEAVSDATNAFNEKLISILSSGPKWYEVGPAKYREMRNNGQTPLPKPVTLDSGKPFSIPSRQAGRKIPCRIMMPESGDPVKAVYMHIHGGGWTFQTENDLDPYLKKIADGASVTTISIGYRLAPEDPFPKGPQDCFDAAEWLVDNAQSEFGAPLKFMGGESAGGHLSVLTALELLKTRANFQFSGLVLNYGCYDLSFLPSARNYPKPLVLTPDIMENYIKIFLPGVSAAGRKDPSISPFYEDLTGKRLPSALFTCGTEDCLLDDTMMMALKWQINGAQTILKLFPGAPHGFTVFPPERLEAAKECMDVVLQYLSEKL